MLGWRSDSCSSHSALKARLSIKKKCRSEAGQKVDENYQADYSNHLQIEADFLDVYGERVTLTLYQDNEKEIEGLLEGGEVFKFWEKSCRGLEEGKRRWPACETCSASVSTPAASSAELRNKNYSWEWVDEHYWAVQEGYGYCDVKHLMPDGNGFREMLLGSRRFI